MAETLLTPARLVFVFPLAAPLISIGQAVDNDLVILERGIVLKHARLERVGDTYAVDDLSGGETWVSLRGLVSDLQPCSRKILQPNALVQFAGALFRFVARAPNAYALEREFEIRHAPTTLGADAANDITLNDPTISRHHAEIGWDGVTYSIRDQHSTNGTYVAFNGDPASERQIETNALRDGSLVRLGNVRLVFRM
jgi:pSer/pThr/pTyr-binding forkhead associated (FHA) protein